MPKGIQPTGESYASHRIWSIYGHPFKKENSRYLYGLLLVVARCILYNFRAHRKFNICCVGEIMVDLSMEDTVLNRIHWSTKGRSQ